MEQLLQIEIDLKQEDFIQVEIIEQTENYINNKKHAVKSLIYKSVVLAFLIVVFLVVKDINNIAVLFPLAFFGFFVLDFLYKYFIGYKKDYQYSIDHLIKADSEGYVFFTPERGLISLYKDRCEYLTNEERRYFSYDKIKHIKYTKRHIIFVLKAIKDKEIRGFLYMILPLRCIKEDEKEAVFTLCEEIKNEYKLSSWVSCPILD